MNSSFPSVSFPSAPTFRRTKTQARGFSLLEVAIALVIFVFGALAIVRIFPGALRVITVGGSRQNALNLNRGAMARVQTGAFTAPYATYDVGQNPDFTWVDGYPGDTSVIPNIPAEPRAVLGSTRRGYSLPHTSNQRDYDDSALGSVRAVVGEGEVVHQTDANPPVLFVLTQFPIYNDSSFRVWEEEIVDGVIVDNAGNLDFSNARFPSGESLSTSAAQPKRPDDSNLRNTNTSSDPNLVYYVTYRYRVTINGVVRVWGVDDEPVVLNKDTTPDTYDSRVTQQASVVSGAVAVRMRRRVTLLTAPDTFGSAPYTNQDASRGVVIGFTGSYVGDGVNPSPRSLQAGDKVTVDYQADWARVLQEGTPDIVPEALSTPVPNPTPGSPRQIALAAPFIEDHATDAVLTTLYSNNNNTFKLTPGGWGEGVAASGMLTPTQQDLRASRITFDMATQPSATARVSYRTRDQWSQQLSVAAGSYKPFFPVNNFEREPWRDYYLIGSTLYFHASEAGKSVMVTYSYNDGTDITLRNRLLTIDDTPLVVTGLPPAFSTRGFASRLQLTDANGDDLSSVPTSISGVRGASVTVRTAWLDGSRYTQSFLTAMRAGTGAEAMP